MTKVAAVVLCAGKGTRMKSETVKVLHPLLGRPLASYPVGRTLEVGADPVVAVVGHQADAVEAALGQLFPGRPLRFALQREQNGTADAVRTAQRWLAGFSGTVLIVYGDTPLIQRETLEALLQTHRAGAATLSLVTARLPDPTGYGRVVRSDGRVVRIVEHKDATAAERELDEVNAGLYAVEADFLWQGLGQIRAENTQRELYLTDLVALAAVLGEVPALRVPWDEMAGVNDRAELAACAKVLQRRINTRHLRAGVSMLDPDSTFIEESVQLAADVELGAQVVLRDGTRISGGARVGQGCILTRSVVEQGAELKPYSVLEEARVGPSCVVGPFARLRPGTLLDEGAHVGNFVETKKARLGPRSKANHLSYLGDAQIGADVNVGAGTITCNYDGAKKHETIIDDGVFVGSDTQLVAPVRVGKGALIAAGTTVTRDVPPDSLVLTRAPAVVKEGWVSRRKKGV
jgi:bifunctional UDP-N-acetylglucosamine pyrophosphorylase/glucosamine-1-phosphate N-acetyltransferase